MDKIPMSRPIFMGCTDFLLSACIIAQQDNDCRLCSPFEKNFCSWDLALLFPTFIPVDAREKAKALPCVLMEIRKYDGL